MELGLAIGLFAAAIAAILPGMGSAKAVGLAGETAAGVSAETPEASSKLTLLQLLPATQGIYGFVIAIVIMAKIGIMGGSGAVVPVDKALMLLAAALPIALVGYFSAIMPDDPERESPQCLLPYPAANYPAATRTCS